MVQEEEDEDEKCRFVHIFHLMGGIYKNKDEADVEGLDNLWKVTIMSWILKCHTFEEFLYQ